MIRWLHTSCILVSTLLMSWIYPVDGQIQYPGRPYKVSGTQKAADILYVLPPLDPLEIEAEKLLSHESEKKVLRFALERSVALSPENHGSWQYFKQHRIWKVHVISPGAYSLGLVFGSYQLEEGVKLFVYDPDQEHIRGAYTSGNNKDSGVLAIGHTPGQELIIEMQVPANMENYGALHIESISHAFLDLQSSPTDHDCPAGEIGCSYACEIDVNCEEGLGWQLSKKSVVRIYTSTQYCTGVLVNNTIYDGTPYLLTTEHCINKSYYSDRSVFAFNYENGSCFGNDASPSMSISGSDVISVGDSIDFSLVKLSEQPPDAFDVYYAGWELSNDQTPWSSAIHHPWGDTKKISFDFDPPATPSNINDVPSDLRDYYFFTFWWIKEWDIGSTERGSSGSPLFNADKRVIGLLSGGTAACGDSIGYDETSNRTIYNKGPNRNDFYTKLNVAWDYNGDTGSSLKPWLDPVNSGVTMLGGYHPTSQLPPKMTNRSNVSIFPNPAKERLYVAVDGVKKGKTLYTIFDLSGKALREGVFKEDSVMALDLHELRSGLYIIQIELQDYTESLKFIVTR